MTELNWTITTAATPDGTDRLAGSVTLDSGTIISAGISRSPADTTLPWICSIVVTASTTQAGLAEAISWCDEEAIALASLDIDGTLDRTSASNVTTEFDPIELPTSLQEWPKRLMELEAENADLKMRLSIAEETDE
jgi:hypothetical protein